MSEALREGLARQVILCAESMEREYAARDIPTGQLYRGIAENNWQRARAAFREAVAALAAQSEQSAAPVPEPWQHESLAMFLAEFEGDDPHQLIWEGNPPEPWGEVWNRYEVEARAIIAFLRDTPAAPESADGEAK